MFERRAGRLLNSACEWRELWLGNEWKDYDRNKKWFMSLEHFCKTTTLQNIGFDIWRRSRSSLARFRATDRDYVDCESLWSQVLEEGKKRCPSTITRRSVDDNLQAEEHHAWAIMKQGGKNKLSDALEIFESLIEKYEGLGDEYYREHQKSLMMKVRYFASIVDADVFASNTTYHYVTGIHLTTEKLDEKRIKGEVEGGAYY
jgi:hypothetical protein